MTDEMNPIEIPPVDPEFIAVAIERLDVVTHNYEVALKDVWGTRLSYFVDGGIALARAKAINAIDQFKILVPDLERPTMIESPPAIRHTDADRQAFVAVHQSNIDALKGFLAIAGDG